MYSSLYQDSFYIGNAFNGILYGAELVLYFQTIQVLIRKDTNHSRTNRFSAIFSTILFFLVTVFVAVQAVFGQEIWIVNAGFQGGAAAYLAAHGTMWYQMMGTTASIIVQLMSDALLIHRCFKVYNNFLILIFPSILLIATLVLGIVELYSSHISSGVIFIGNSVHIGLAYVSVSVGFNVIISCMICARALYARTGAQTTQREDIARYGGIVSIIVESSLLYAMAGIPFVVSYGMGSQISVIFMSIYIMSACISSQLIIIHTSDSKMLQRNRHVLTIAIAPRHTISGEDVPAFELFSKPHSETQFNSSHTFV